MKPKLRYSDFTRRHLLETGLVLCIFLTVWMLLSKDHHLASFVMASLVVSLIAPFLWYPLAVIWFGLAWLLSLVVQKILLAIIYFVVVAPVAIVRRLQGKDDLQIHEFKNGSSSVFKPVNHKIERSDFEKLY